ncbi:hypothetical protein HYDPIDRAFT_111787 [Hydnomerulius pinastri MD-312]|uniref:U4/U6 snRNA-associated-splicing factor PRP24 n=1 Tax=Hydnomerulius pinastri MD-312 TaxID=994086 RepID=A0A0C9W0X2_9AGAM|nr:hypothetical protein HYDPIDRAFT_111787 [Hydnomerulius pinastri MD-312]
MESQVGVAQEMATNYLAVGDDVWLPLINAKTTSADLDIPTGASEVLDLYTRAEEDYLSIPILQRHIEFLVDRHAHYATLETPEESGGLFSTPWTREAIAAVVAKGTGHLTKSRLLWEAQKDWELEMLETAPNSEKSALVEHVESLHLMRLQQPHAGHEETYQSYSSFTTAYKPPAEYESLLVSASKLRSRAVKAYEQREPTELSLASLDAYAQYIAKERRSRTPHVFVITGLYERALAEAARRRFAGEEGAELALRAFWVGYLDFLRTEETDEDDLMRALRRATRSVPGSGEVWSRYIRHLERKSGAESEDVSMDETESISDAYNRALSTNLFTKPHPKSPDLDPEQIVPLVLARAGAEKRAIEAGIGAEDAVGTLVKVVEDGLGMVRGASKTGDQRFRLEKFLSEFYLSLADVPDAAIQLWASTAAHYKSSWAGWVAYTDVLIRTDHHALARSTFLEMSTKNLDYPEALWDAWLNFEHAHGSLESIEDAMGRIERARGQVEARRMREAQKAYAAAQYAMEQQATSLPVASAPVPDVGQTSGLGAGDGMDVDAAPVASSDARGKRKASDEPEPEVSGSKKARIDQPPAALKRDRENCTVFVADLPSGASDDQLKALFKDCGEIREVKITNMPEMLGATIEFNTRDSVPAALTKDKKRIDGTEISVHLAWRSTLYVTNFPEKTDDAAIRDLFGQYGIIFDVRWPSKKFKTTRRFCYVQFTSPASAERALELHGRELEPERALSVYISNPERKKERTDADANEREVYVAGLSRFTNKEDLRAVFSRYGPIKDIRPVEDKDGRSKGFAFIEFENEADAHTALGANNYELKKRRIAVTLTDTRVRSKNREGLSETGLGRRAEARNRSVHIHGLPSDTQEGLLQQVLEKYAAIKRTEFFADKGEAVVELENPAEAGKLLLRTEPIVFNGINLQISEETQSGSSRSQPAAPPTNAGGMFIPRAAGSRPRAGLGRARKPGLGATKPSAATSNMQEGGSAASSGAKGRDQDDFRKMLG